MSKVAQQWHAVEKAASAANKVLVYVHIDPCLGRAINSVTPGASAALDNFKEMTKYL